MPDVDITMEGVTPRWRDLAAFAQLAEDVGFDSVWVEDHFMFRFEQTDTERRARLPSEGVGGPWECFSLLSAVAAVTQRVEIGTLVTCTSFRTPALTAKIADTIDEISDGRLILGLGSGWHEPEYQAMGIPFDHKVSRFEEAIRIIHGLLREGRVDFEGKYYSARECELTPRGPRRGGPPIMVGATGPRMLQLTAQYGDLWNAYFVSIGNELSGIAPLRAKVDAGCQAVGRDPATLARSVALLVDAEGNADIPELLSMGVKALTGPPEALAETLRAFAAEGIGHVQLHPYPWTLASVEALAPVLEALDRG